MIVYRCTCIESGKSYVGVTTKTLKERMSRHMRESVINKSKSIFHKAIKRYGREQFVWEVLDNVMFVDSMFALERYYIEKLNTLSPNGYNLSPGGMGCVGYKWSAEDRLKLSESRKNQSAETRKKISESKMGKLKSPETRAKMSIVARNRPPMSPETKKKISEAHKGKYCGVNSPSYGRVVSEETRKKISDTKKLNFLNKAEAKK